MNGESVKGYQPPHFKIISTITRIPYVLESSISAPYRQISHPKCPLLTEMQLKLSSINTAHVKQQYWVFHFQVHSMVHAR